MPRSSPVRVAAPVDVVRRTATDALGAVSGGPDTLSIPVQAAPDPSLRIVLRVVADGDGTVVSLHRTGRLDVPFFGWAFRPLVSVAARRAVTHAVGVLRNRLEDGPPPRPERGVVGLPPVAFSPAQSTMLATAAAAVAVVTFGSALFGQLSGPIGDSFGASDATLGVSLAVTRVGALVALFVTAFADRRGRRRAILVGLVGCAAAAAVSAVAPTLAVFTVAQVFQRACVITTATVAGIAAIEEAPEGARAYAASMLAMAGGFGFSFAVVALPLADRGADGWRIPYVFAAASIVLAPRIAASLRETSRYLAIESRTDIPRGRLKELLGPRYGRRFLVLATIGFLTAIFNAPSSQLMNKYLLDEHDFSNTGIAVFRAATTALPGLVGLLVGGRLAEAHGRKPVAIVALLVATLSQMVFFLSEGPTLWLMSAVSVLTSSAAGIALATLDAELFPTEVRSTANAFLTVVAVVGSSTGLVLAGVLSDPLDGIGRGIALLGIGSLVAAVLFVPRLPETGARNLDDVSPSEPLPGYRLPDV